MSTRVWAIRNGGDWYNASDGNEGLLLEEVDAGQCEDCGSWDEETQAPGGGFVLRLVDGGVGSVYQCACCKRRVSPVLTHEDNVVF